MVVIIIGILAAISVPIYLNQRKSAWNSQTESDVKNASLVVETASTANNGKLPSEINGATATCSKSQNTGCTLGGNTITVTEGVTLVQRFSCMTRPTVSSLRLVLNNKRHSE